MATTHNSDASSSLSQSTRLIIGALAVVIVIGVGATLLYERNSARTEKANDSLFTAQKTLEKELQAIAKAEAPTPPKPTGKTPDQTPPAPGADTVIFKKMDVDAKLPESIKKFQAVIQEFPGTRAAYEAQMALGGIYLNHGTPAKAASWYEQAAKGAPSGFEKASAYSALGYAHENSNKLPEALSAYETAINQGEATLKGDLLMSKARVLELMKDSAKAKTTYDQVIAQLPNTEYAKNAEIYKAQLN